MNRGSAALPDDRHDLAHVSRKDDNLAVKENLLQRWVLCAHDVTQSVVHNLIAASVQHWGLVPGYQLCLLDEAPQLYLA